MNSKSRKGQYLTIEQLIVFTMGILVLTTTALVYNSARVNVKTITVEDQFREAAELTLSNVIYAYISGKNNNLNSEVIFNIPKELSSQAYLITLNKTAISIISFEDPANNVSIHIGTINNTVELQGNASSPNGRAKINYNLSSNIISLGDI